MFRNLVNSFGRKHGTPAEIDLHNDEISKQFAVQRSETSKAAMRLESLIAEMLSPASKLEQGNYWLNAPPQS